MKKILLFIIPILFIFAITQSCSKEESEVTTKADELVASEEFQKAQMEIENLGYKIKENYTNLSISDKKKFDNLEMETDPIKRLEQMSIILNIDFRSELSNIHTSIGNIQNDFKDVSKKDLLVSIEKKNIQNEPLLKGGGEDDKSYRTGCVIKCAALMTTAMIVCDTIGTPLAWVACAALATAGYTECVKGCEI